VELSHGGNLMLENCGFWKEISHELTIHKIRTFAAIFFHCLFNFLGKQERVIHILQLLRGRLGY
jgi:hypothetical protein